jgi:ParB family chromosome partitioning protein
MARGSEIITLRPDDIEVRERIGLLWQERVEGIAASMRVEGQIEPILVRRTGPRADKPWRLVAGIHRLEAARAIGTTIDAIEVEGDPDQLRAVEAAENIHRRDLGPIEKALYLRALADAHEAKFSEGFDGLTPQQIGQIKRWREKRNQVQWREDERAEFEALNSAAIVAGLYGWQEAAAAAAGLSAGRLRDYLRIHRLIIQPFATLYEALARHPLGQKRASVMAIAQIDDEGRRRAAIEAIIANPEIKTVDEALRIVDADPGRGNRPADQERGQSQFLSRAMSNLTRLHSSTWRSWAPQLAELIQPSALTAVRDAIDARIAALRAAGKLKDGEA